MQLIKTENALFLTPLECEERILQSRLKEMQKLKAIHVSQSLSKNKEIAGKNAE